MIYTGSYAEETSAGIHLFKLNVKEKKLDLVEKYTGIENPSFLVINKDQTHLYAVSEVEYGMVVSYAINRQSEQIRELNRKSTNGMAPCYVSLCEKESCLYNDIPVHRNFHILFMPGYVECRFRPCRIRV